MSPYHCPCAFAFHPVNVTIMRHRTICGKLSYRHDTKGETGREWFTVTVQPDGTRTHRAHCEMDDDAILRDVINTMDGNWLPKDSYVRLSVGGVDEGSAWFLIKGNQATCESWSKGGGRLRQAMTFDEPIHIFGGHPVSGDAMKPAHFKLDGPAKQSFLMVSTSPLPNGASGPIMAARRGVFQPARGGGKSRRARKFQSKILPRRSRLRARRRRHRRRLLLP